MTGWFMEEYPKIQSLYKRDAGGGIIPGDWATPELEFLRDCRWLWTEKIDGTNVRVGWSRLQPGIRFAGRHTDQLPPKLRGALEASLGQEDFERAFPEGTSVTLYGEGYGAGIQRGGGRYRPDQGLVLFDVVVDGWWLSYESVLDVAGKLGLGCVPLVGSGTLPEMADRVWRGLGSSLAVTDAEGLVARTPVGLRDRRGRPLFAKIKARDFPDTTAR